MASVLCLDIKPETMAVLQRTRDPLDLVEAENSGHVVAALEHDPTATDVLLLGVEVGDPFRVAHHAGSVDEDLAVVIMARQASVDSMGKAIEFLPTLTSDVTCASVEDVQALGDVLEHAARRTQSRRITRAQFRAAMASSAESIARSPAHGEFLVRLLDQVPVAVVVLNANGLMQTCNPLAANILMCTEQDLINRPLVMLFPQLEWERLSQFLARCSATERRIPSEEFPFMSPAGDTIPIVVQATPFRGRGGDRGTLVFLQRRAGYAADVASRSRSAGRIGGLRHLDSVAWFAGEVAHELNNELTPVVGNTDLLLHDDELSEARRPVLERILAGGTKAAAIANQLQVFTGSRPLQRGDVDLRQLVQRELPHLQKTLPSTIALVAETEVDDLPLVFADAELLTQVLRNLVTVATQAIGTQEGRIRISLGQERPRSDRLLREPRRDELLALSLPYLEVSDNAAGNDAESPLGDAEQPGAPSLNVNWRLAAVVAAMRSHDGMLEVDFPPGGGMSYRVLLPPPGVVKALQVKKGWNTKVSGEALLIVDDEEAVLSLTKNILEMHDLSAITAGTVKEALAIFRSRSVEIRTIVMDAGLCIAEADAVAEFRTLRPDLSIILCSGYDHSRVEDQIAALDAAAFLQKPFTVEELMKTVESVLETKPG